MDRCQPISVCVPTVDLKDESFRLRGKPRSAEPAETAKTVG